MSDQSKIDDGWDALLGEQSALPEATSPLAPEHKSPAAIEAGSPQAPRVTPPSVDTGGSGPTHRAPDAPPAAAAGLRVPRILTAPLAGPKAPPSAAPPGPTAPP
ncbi:MAG: hypothetical protein AAGF11_43045, partial [Myxococcota bacterium]